MDDETRELEEGTRLNLDFGKLADVTARNPSVLPVAVQNADSGQVILVAYVNRQALEESIRTRIATFWSTTRNELWVKGATSGNSFELLEIRVNCEQNSLVFIVRSTGEGICHTFNKAGRSRDCYYRKLDLETGELTSIDP